MITDTEYAPHLDADEKHIFMCDHLELAITQKQLKTIVRLHNRGYDLFDISKNTRLHTAKVKIDKLHQATVSNRSHNKNEDRITRHILYRLKRKGEER